MNRAYIPLLLFWCCLGCHCQTVATPPTSIKIGLLVHKELNSLEAQVFRMAINSINTNPIILPLTKVIPLLEVATNKYELLEKVKKLLSEGVIAVIGPFPTDDVMSVHFLFDKVNIPLIAPSTGSEDFVVNPSQYPYTLRLSASDHTMVLVVAEMVHRFGWKRMAVLAPRTREGFSGLIALSDFVDEKDWDSVHVEYFSTMFPVFLQRHLRLINESNARIVFLKCSGEEARVVMKTANQMNMIEDWVWILSSSAAEDLFDARKPVPPYLRGLIAITPSIGKGRMYGPFKFAWSMIGGYESTPKSVRVYDAAVLLASTFNKMILDGKMPTSGVPQSLVECGNSTKDKIELTPWKYGQEFMHRLASADRDGVMNRIHFDESRGPITSYFDIKNLQDEGFMKVGSWSNVDNKLKMEKDIVWPSGKKPRDSPNFLRNKTIRIVAKLIEPFVMKDNSTNPPRYYGLCIDILEKISPILGFNYTVYEPSDGMVGVYNKELKLWSGVIGDLMYGHAQLAIGAISITPSRRKAVDFTQPYMRSGLQIAMKIPPAPQPNYFRFLQPFTWRLWCVIFVAMVTMGVVNWLFSILSPNGFYGKCAQASSRAKIKPADWALRNSLGFFNAVWASCTYYLANGPDGLHPVSGAGRMAVALWWFCITILTSTYTANLTQFLIGQRLRVPIKSVHDLWRQKEILYGTVDHSSSRQFFEYSQVARYMTMWQFMQHKGTLKKSLTEGLETVVHSDGKYAFIHDAPLLEYFARSKFCGLIEKVGPPFGVVSFGFALQPNSPFTADINMELMRMSFRGEIDELKYNWFYEKIHCHADDMIKKIEEDQVAKNTDDGTGDRMGVEEMFGVFIIMLGGIGLGLVLLFCELIVGSCRDVNRKEFDKRPRSFREACTRRLSRVSKKDFHPRLLGDKMIRYQHDEDTMSAFLQAASLASRGNAPNNQTASSPPPSEYSIGEQAFGRGRYQIVDRSQSSHEQEQSDGRGDPWRRVAIRDKHKSVAL